MIMIYNLFPFQPFITSFMEKKIAPEKLPNDENMQKLIFLKN